MGGVTGEIGGCLSGPFGLDARQLLAVAAQGGVGRIDHGQQLVGQEPARPMRGQAVEDPGPVRKSLDQTGLGQQFQMARHARLALAENGAEFQHRKLFPRQQGEDAQTGRLPRRAQDLDRLSR